MPASHLAAQPLTDKVALVTGASRGIGKAIATHLVTLGAKVAITSRNTASLESAAADIDPTAKNILVLTADAADPKATSQCVATIESQFGPIDLLVNNAGIAIPEVPLDDLNIDAFQQTIAVNLNGPIAYTSAVLKNMIQRNSGCIINLSSYAAIRPCSWGIAYATSKAGLARFTDSLAAALAETAIHCFTISPGLVHTDMTAKLPFADNIPANQWNDIQQAPQLVACLATGNYAALSGRFIHVNDDLDSLLQNAERISDEGLYQLRLNQLQGPLI